MNFTLRIKPAENKSQQSRIETARVANCKRFLPCFLIQNIYAALSIGQNAKIMAKNAIFQRLFGLRTSSQSPLLGFMHYNQNCKVKYKRNALKG